MQLDDLREVSLERLIEAQNWQAKYRLLTDWGKLILPKPHIRTDPNQLKGCETKTWLVHVIDGDRHRFAFDSESRVMNGLAALLLSLIDNRTRTELLLVDIAVLLRQADLEKHMTPSRNNGFKTIIARAFAFAGVEKFSAEN